MSKEIQNSVTNTEVKAKKTVEDMALELFTEDA
jgi:hypothetical protein